MEITINVNVNAPELVSSLQALAVALGQQSPFQSVNIASPVVTTESGKSEFTIKLPSKEVPASVQADTPPATPPETTSETPKETSQPTITLEQVRSKLAQLSQSGKQAQVKELITKFGASKLTEIPAEKYSELLAEAEAIA